MFTKDDEKYMRIAMELAEEGRGFTGTNPLVGAVIVKDKRIIGKGAHLEYGKAHAERNAIASLKESAEGATMYVTLEPCCHYGKTPPCTEAILENKIRRVVIALKDPNPKVAGGGIKILKDSSVTVEVGLLAEECAVQNQIFLHYITTGLPLVTMKYAMTMDGKISTFSGLSKWITGEKAREKVHQDRSQSAGIMVGIGTVLADDPLLTARIPKGKNPVRIIVDSKLQIPLDSRILSTSREVPTLIAASDALLTNSLSQGTAPPLTDKIKATENLGAEIIYIKEDESGHLDLKELMKELGRRKINSLILEGGGNLNFSALQAGIVDKVQCYIAPKLFGGKDAKTPVEGDGVYQPSDAVNLETTKIETIGSDILIESKVIKCLQE